MRRRPDGARKISAPGRLYTLTAAHGFHSPCPAPLVGTPMPISTCRHNLLTPYIRVSFRTLDELGTAQRLIAQDKPTVGLPHRCLIVDIDQLRLLKNAGIPVYSADTADRRRYKKQLDIDAVIAKATGVHQPEQDLGRASVRPA